MSKPTLQERIENCLKRLDPQKLEEAIELPEGMGANALIELLQAEVENKFDDEKNHKWAWVEEVFADTLVFRKDGEYFRVGYTFNAESKTVELESTANKVTRVVKYESHKGKKSGDSVQLAEHIDAGKIFEGATFDANSLVIKNVAFIGSESLNGYEYSEQALREIPPLLEGKPQYINHYIGNDESEPREIQELFSKAVNIRYIAEENKVRGDMHLVDTPTIREEILPRMKHFKDQIGNSLVSYGEMSEQDGNQIVAHVSAVESADLVTDPATNKGLFESVNQNPNNGGNKSMSITLKDVKDNPKVWEEVKAEILKDVEDAAALDALKKENDFLKKENSDLKQKNEEHELKDAITEKKEQIATLVGESKVLQKYSEQAITKEWLESLERDCKYEVDIKERIKEREKVITSLTEKKVNKEKDIDRMLHEKVDGEVEETTDKELSEIAHTMN